MAACPFPSVAPGNSARVLCVLPAVPRAGSSPSLQDSLGKQKCFEVIIACIGLCFKIPEDVSKSKCFGFGIQERDMLSVPPKVFAL